MNEEFEEDYGSNDDDKENPEVPQFLEGLIRDRLLVAIKTRNLLEKILGNHKDEEMKLKTYLEQFQNNPSLFSSSSSSPSQENRKIMEDPNLLSLVQQQITELEDKYHSEFERRVKLQKAFLNFKNEGTSIIDRLRFALRQVGSKYKKEKLKNRHLLKRLNETILNSKSSDGIPEDEKIRKLKQLLASTCDELQKYKSQFSRVEKKFLSYKSMVSDHKKVITSLKLKNGKQSQEILDLKKRLEMYEKKESQQPSLVQEEVIKEKKKKKEEEEEEEVDDNDNNNSSSSSNQEEEEEEEEGEEGEDDDDTENISEDQNNLVSELLDNEEEDDDEKVVKPVSFLESQIESRNGSLLMNDEY